MKWYEYVFVLLFVCLWVAIGVANYKLEQADSQRASLKCAMQDLSGEVLAHRIRHGCYPDQLRWELTRYDRTPLQECAWRNRGVGFLDLSLSNPQVNQGRALYYQGFPDGYKIVAYNAAVPTDSLEFHGPIAGVCP